MNPLDTGIFAHQTISNYPFKRRIFIRLAGFLSWLLIRVAGPTFKFEVHGAESLDEILTKHHPTILCPWHDSLVSGVYYGRERKFVALTSPSFDAEFAARCAVRFGWGVVRGSSSRGGVRAMNTLTRVVGQGYGAVLPVDGPRGPRHVVKQGAIFLAGVTGATVIPIILKPKNAWKLNSWDKMLLPKPFTPIVVVFGRPIKVPANLNDEEMEQKRLDLQTEMDNCERRAAEVIGEGPTTN